MGVIDYFIEVRVIKFQFTIMADSVLVVRRHVDSWQVMSCYLEERHSLEECQAAALSRNSEAEAERCGVIYTVHSIPEDIASAVRFLIQDRTVDRSGLSEEVSQLTAEVSDLLDTVRQLQQSVESRLSQEDAED